MLTATYTLVAFSIEQGKVRDRLQSAQALLQTSFRQRPRLTKGQLGYACDALRRVYDSCHWRKLDMFLMPAIRRATREADPLLDELELLSRAAAGALACCVATAHADTAAAVARFCDAIDLFCGAIDGRIEREERELFAVARSVIPGETWFAIANQMLVHDARRQDSKPARRAPLLSVPLHPEHAAEHRFLADLTD